MDENYQNLANAIIILAAKDYRAALRRLKKSPGNQMAESEIKELERFFRSPWYEMLTDVDGEYLIKRIREDEEENESKTKTKKANPRESKRNGGLKK